MFSPKCRREYSLATIILISFILPTAIAISANDRWIDITTTPEYTNLESCNQDCLMGVSTTLGCWAYGCVCSSNDQQGKNVMEGYKNVTACARNNQCPSPGAASDAFQEICSVSFSAVASGTTTIPTASLQVPTATSTFKAEDAVMIDLPDDSYNALNSPCLRWVFNACKSKKDNPQNCHPDKAGDNSSAWNGLGAFMECSTSECLCRYPNFDYSSERVFGAAMQYCGVEPPTQEEPSEVMGNMMDLMAGYCSEEGFVLMSLLLGVHGQPRQQGLSTEAKIGIGVGAASFVVTIVFGVLTYMALR